MSALVVVPDVIPPDDLSLVRERSSRLVSLLLVLAALGMSCVLVFVPTAAATPAVVLIPVAKAVGATAVSALTAEAFEAMWKGDGDKPADDDDSERAKKGRGKWGEKLKGVPGLAVSLLGLLWGAAEETELLPEGGDGVPLPEDFAEDIPPDPGDAFANFAGGINEFTVLEVSFAKTPYGWQMTTRADLECKSEDTSKCISPTGAIAQSTVNIRCFNADTRQYYAASRIGVNMNGTTSLSSSCRRTVGGQNVMDPLQSGYVRMHSDVLGGKAGQIGLKNPQRWLNHDFSEEDAPEVIGSITAEVECAEVGTGAKQTVSKTVSGGGGVMPLAPCPTGWAPESIGWTQQPAGGGPAEWLGGVKPTTPQAYPDCPPGQCVRIIEVDGQPCNAHRPECFDWMNTQPPSRLKCEYGPYNMPIAECADLEHVHKSTQGVTWAPGPNGQPQWVPARPDGTPDPTRVGTIWAPEDEPNRDYRPPTRGPIIKAPTQTDPTGTPTPTPTPTAQPPVGNPPVVNPPGGPKDVEQPTKNCIAGMASWNPVDWVYTPVKCALTWAFVPKHDDGAFLRFRQNFTDAGLDSWLAIPPMLFGDLPQGSGCQGPPLTMPASLGGRTYYPLNACADPMAKYANMSRSLITVVVVFYGMFSVVNSLTTALTGYRMFDRETAQVTKGMS